MAELPDAKKWFSGFIDVTRYIKDAGTIIRMVVIVASCYALLIGGIALYKKWVPPPKQKTTLGDVTGQNAKVDASTSNTKTIKTYIISPLCSNMSHCGR